GRLRPPGRPDRQPILENYTRRARRDVLGCATRSRYRDTAACSHPESRGPGGGDFRTGIGGRCSAHSRGARRPLRAVEGDLSALTGGDLASLGYYGGERSTLRASRGSLIGALHTFSLVPAAGGGGCAAG